MFLYQKYWQWANALTSILMGEGHWPSIIGEIATVEIKVEGPGVTAAEAGASVLHHRAKMVTDAKAMTCLQKYFGGEVLKLVCESLAEVNQRNPQAVWEEIKRIFKDRTGREKAQIASQFYKWTCGPDVKKSLLEFDQIHEKCEEVGLGITEYMYANKLLTGLPATDTYRSFVTVCHAKGDKLTLQEIRDFVRAQVTEESAHDDERMTTGFLAKPWIETRTCYNCKKKGHVALNCPNPKKKLGHDDVAAAFMSMAQAFYAEHFTTNTNNKSSSTYECVIKEFALLSDDVRQSGRVAHSWVCDSGSGEHMCNDQNSSRHLPRQMTNLSKWLMTR